MNDLVGFIFNISSCLNCVFNSGWDIEFIVATKFKFSCVDNLSIICIT